MNAEQQALLEEALNSPAPIPAPPQELQQSPTGTQPASERAADLADGGVSLTIPLHITVRLGAVQQVPITSSPGGNQSHTPLPVTTTTAEEAVATIPITHIAKAMIRISWARPSPFRS
jgi:endonuclease G